MIRLTNGDNVRWREGDDQHWETGQVVVSEYGDTISYEHGGQLVTPDNCTVLVALTYGGLAFVEHSRLERIPDRAEWETEKGGV